MNLKSGRGIDIGTGFMVSAGVSESGDTITKSVRHSFLELCPPNKLVAGTMKKGLIKAGVNFFETDGKFFVLGEDSLIQAVERQMTTKRPMAKGVISPKEAKALPLFKKLLQELLGEPLTPNEKIIFSIPASPIDAPFDVDYHESVIISILASLGFEGRSINEAHAIAFSELGSDEDNYTGVTISCLLPDQEIITSEGFKEIQNVNVNDKVLSGLGNFEKVYSIVSQHYSGKVRYIKLMGSSDPIKVTNNHKIKVYKGNNLFEWVEAGSVKVGDLLCEPSLSRVSNVDEKNKQGQCYFTLRATKHAPARNIIVSRPTCRFITSFLGDGHVLNSRGEIFITLNKKETDIAQELQDTIKTVFNRESYVLNKTDNSIRIGFGDVGLQEWLLRECYDSNGEKRFPLDIQTMNVGQVVGCLEGFINTDGWLENIQGGGCGFTNTSKSLACAFYLLLGRLGIPAYLSVREPKTSTLKDGRVIVGRKKVYDVTVNGVNRDILNTYLSTTRISERFIVGNHIRFSKVSSIEEFDYDGDVYDIGVENEPSFCVAGATLHNCGSGMTNVAVVNTADLVCAFSVARGGDYIDMSAATSLGYEPQDNKCDITPSLVTFVKEQGVDLINLDQSDRIKIAIAAYYKSLVRYVVSNLIKELNNQSNTRFTKPIKFVVSGGTSLAPGFIKLFSDELLSRKDELPFQIKEVVHASQPLQAVGIGALLALLSEL